MVLRLFTLHLPLIYKGDAMTVDTTRFKQAEKTVGPFRVVH
jgi:hypothetical protein